ncbi:MICOS complex subunit Mic12 family protein [Rhodotorula paludigena]|uniref:MICOS complex subunit Mic12 family protein n=1 Tax=Rhodotorula paludigena TaxID=86838 RepID=UPI00317E1D20
MSFFLKFLTGSAIGGGLTLYYQDDIRRTTTQLTSDLHRLSDELVRAAPTSHPAAEAEAAHARGPVIPARLPFSEEVKARWNEQLGSAIHTAQTTDWSLVLSRAYTSVRSSIASLSAPAPAPIEAGGPGPASEAARVAAAPPPMGAVENKVEKVAASAGKGSVDLQSGKRWV